MARETGKQRRSRIEQDYYRQPDAIGRWRRPAVALAVLAVVAGIGLAPVWDVGRPRVLEWGRLASHGPLARAHATWDSRCEACHVPFTPVNGSAWSPIAAGDRRASDRLCQGCHAGPPHHAEASRNPADAAACAACHRDHRGRDASLVRLDDADCTRCHGGLDAHRKPPGPGVLGVAPNVHGFNTDHPEFRFVGKTDPGRIRFNHARHLTPGMPAEGGGPVLRYADLPEPDRARYGWKSGQPLEAPVALDCAACHRLDPADLPGSAAGLAAGIPPRQPGALFLPIRYEADCAACHPLRVDPREPERAVPHGLQPAELAGLLAERHAAQAVAADPALLERPIPPRPRPDRPDDRRAVAARAAIEARTIAALRTLLADAPEAAGADRPPDRGGCVLCHHLSPAADPTRGLDGVRAARVEPAGLKAIWFDRAAFDHAAHRALDCKGCHAGAASSTRAADVLLPGIASCRACHAPTGHDDRGRPAGGAGFACTECHRYHNSNQPDAGPGALARGADRPGDFARFLRGAPPR